jgi:hypothetical protein
MVVTFSGMMFMVLHQRGSLEYSGKPSGNFQFEETTPCGRLEHRRMVPEERPAGNQDTGQSHLGKDFLFWEPFPTPIKIIFLTHQHSNK